MKLKNLLSSPEYKTLERAATSKKSRHALASANIKRELKRLFPLQKFSTKSDSYSRGNSVHIHWANGPTVKEVDAITDKYQYADFNGMEDISENRRTGNAFRDLFGSSKYVSCSREFSEGIREQVKAEYEKNYALGNLEGWELQRHNEREVNALIRSTSFYEKGELIGIVDLNRPEYEDKISWCPKLALAFKETVKPEPEPGKEASTETIEGGAYTIEHHRHSKRGFMMFLVIPKDRLPKDRFSALLASAKEAGGWYSRAWEGIPGGYAFKEESKARAFAAEAFGTPEETKAEGVQLDLFGKKETMYRQEVKGVFVEEAAEVSPEAIEEFKEKYPHLKQALGRTKRQPPSTAVSTIVSGSQPTIMYARAAIFREQADKLQTAIDSAFAPISQNPTPKRLHEQQCRRLNGEDLERAQTAFRAMADAIEADYLPVELRSVKSKAAVLRLVTQGKRDIDYYTTAGTGEYSDKTPEGKALQALIEDCETVDPDREKKLELEKLEHEVALMKIPGFFPTPKALAERMAEMAEIGSCDEVLEPSAGTGRLAEEAREAGGVVTCIESNGRLARILELKGLDTYHGDFTEELNHLGLIQFDAVIMNPPFERRQDAEHVTEAYKCLKDGGRLVAIMGEGVFFGTDSKAVAFRGWLDSVGGTVEKLPEGTFKESGTGVNSRLVFIRK